jgi:26S proteasome regulatory subunit N7
MDYKDFVFYTVVMALVTQDRKTLKSKIIHSSDILSVIRDIPHLKQFVESFYNCEYRLFFESFAEILAAIGKDVYLKDHLGYYAREMRLVAYR